MAQFVGWGGGWELTMNAEDFRPQCDSQRLLHIRYFKKERERAEKKEIMWF